VNSFNAVGGGISMAAAGAQIYLPVRNRVLIASADPLFRLRVMKKAVFAQSDCEQAVGGAHALAKLKQITCTNVLLDRYLPDLDSEELAKLIQKRYRKITVGFLDSKTADQSEPYERDASVTPRVAATQEDRPPSNESSFSYAASATAPAPGGTAGRDDRIQPRNAAGLQAGAHGR
jgi:CheY-like chemotaxis protein